jgi:hypothetical protein
MTHFLPFFVILFTQRLGGKMKRAINNITNRKTSSKTAKAIGRSLPRAVAESLARANRSRETLLGAAAYP